MAFNIEGFRQALPGGGVRSNLFEVMLFLPPAVSGMPRDNSNEGQEPFRFLCHSAGFPGTSFGTMKPTYFGRVINLPGDRSFDKSQDFSIYNDEDFAVRSMMENWMALISMHSGNLREQNLASTSNYMTNIDVKQYSKTGEVLKAYRLMAAFPTSVGAEELKWNQDNSISSTKVTFTYSWWEAEGTTDTQ